VAPVQDSNSGPLKYEAGALYIYSNILLGNDDRLKYRWPPMALPTYKYSWKYAKLFY